MYCNIWQLPVFHWIPMAKKLATTIYITESQNLLLKELNRRSKVPVAEFIREGIDLVLEKHRDLLPGQMSLGGALEDRLPNTANTATNKNKRPSS